MNKKEFLRELETRLSILDETEIKDIVNEYKDIIEEKVKDGKKESEAVEEFGSIDELCSEILKAYKINPKFSENKKKDPVRSFEDWVKNAASEMSRFAKGIGNNLSEKGKTLSMDTFFEILIKIIILLVILAILRIPFNILGFMGRGFFNIGFSPLDFAFGAIWYILATIVYLGLAIFIFWILFREYFSGLGEENVVEEPEKDKDKTKEVKSKKEQKKDEVKVAEENNALSSLLIVVRIFTVICFLLPLWLTQATLFAVMILVFYYVITGINIIGLLLILVGVLIGLAGLSSLIYDLAFRIKKVRIHAIIPMVVSLPFLIVGGIIFAYNILSFDYIETPVENRVNFIEVENTFRVRDNYQIELDRFDNVEYLENEEYEDNKVTIIISYADSFRRIRNIHLRETQDDYRLVYDFTHQRSTREIKKIFDMFIQDLRDGKVFNYSRLYIQKVTIIANAETIERIK